MKTPREALMNLVEKAHEAASKAQVRSQWKAAAKHLARAERFLKMHDEAGR